MLGQPRGCPGFPRAWGTLSVPGAGAAVPQSGSGSTATSALSNSDSKQQQPAAAAIATSPAHPPRSRQAARDGDACVAPSAPGAEGGRGDDVYSVVSLDIMHRRQRRPVFSV